jgi:sugar phosphate isomerase/epimerase
MGYDFIEVPLSPFGLEDDESLREAKAIVSRVDLPMRVFNWFFPQDMMIVGPKVDQNRIKGYLARAAELMHSAKAKVGGVGSGWARSVPQGFDRARAEQQLLEAFNWCADALEGTGVTLAIESQNRKETNIIQSIPEAVLYAQRVNRPEVRVMGDFYHMDEEGESLENLETCGSWLVHMQCADTGRLNPGTGSYDYTRFFDSLRAGGYEGGVSVECMVEISEPEMRKSLEFLRNKSSR